MERLNRGQCTQCKQHRRSWRHSIQLIFFCCFIAAASGYFFWLPGRTAFSGTHPGSSRQSISSPAMSRAVMPSRYPVHAVVRDPFAVPPEFQPAAVAAALPSAKNYSSVQASAVLPSATPESSLELTGTVSGGGQQVAIIKRDGVSRSYLIKEYIGIYQLVTIGEGTATLRGPQGEKVLTLER